MLVDRVRQALRLDEIEGRFDPLLLLSALLLATIGVVMVGSSSIAIGESLGSGPHHYLVRHLVFLAIGLVAAFVLMRLELKTVERYAVGLLLFSAVLLLAVLVPGIGRTVNGAQRWLNLGFFGFQAVEAVKLMFIVWLASYLVRYREQVRGEWLGVIKPMVVAGLFVGLLLAQPDFGSALLLCAIMVGMLVLGGAAIPRIIAPGLLAVPLLVWAATSESYRMRRLTSFMDPWADPFDAGFQLTQALIAIGRGEWFGVGLGASVQKLFYLPEAHTDFIFSVIAEETGLLGVLVVIALYAAFVGSALRIGLRAAELGRHFSANCAFGIALWIGLQAMVSIGVNFGVLPTKGLTLPLISSGGSSVIMTCAAVGLLLRVSYELDRAQRQVVRLRQDRLQDPAELAAALASDARAASERAGLARGGRVEPGLRSAA